MFLGLITIPLASYAPTEPMIQRLSIVCAIALLLAACRENVAETLPGTIEVSPTDVTFPLTSVGRSADVFLTIRNIGSGDLELDDVTLDVTTDYVRTDFNGPLILAPDEQATVRVTYEPQGAEFTQGDLHIISDDPSNGDFVVSINSIQPGPQARVTPNPIDFGVVREGVPSTRTVVLQNIGSAPLIVCDMITGTGSTDITDDVPDRLDALGIGPDEFLVMNVPEVGATGAGFATFDFEVRYLPSAPGADEDVLIIQYDSLGVLEGACSDDRISSVEIDIAGEAGTAVLATNCPIDFGTSSIDNTSRETVSMTNVGSLPLEIIDIRIDRSRSSNDFGLEDVPSLQDPITMAANESRGFIVSYFPTDFTADGGVVEIEHTDGSGSVAVTECLLSGVGIDNECPVAVVEGTVREDTLGRRGTQINWGVPLQTLIADGGQSFDPDGGSIVEYRWEIVRRPDAAVNGLRPNETRPDDDSTTQYFIPIAGVYEIELRVVDDAGCVSPPASITAVAVPNELISVELTWFNPGDPLSDNQGADVDLHLTRLPEGYFFHPQFDTYYSNQNPIWSGEEPSLDIDDTNGDGPETIQMDSPSDCRWYGIGAHYFRKEFGTAYPTVRVYINGILTQEFFSNRGLRNTDDFWDIARIHWDGGTATVFEVDEIIENIDSALQADPATRIAPLVTPAMEASNLCGTF